MMSGNSSFKKRTCMEEESGESNINTSIKQFATKEDEKAISIDVATEIMN